MSLDYDASDNSAKCYELAIKTLREKLESFRREQIGDCTLYQGDCLDLVPLLPVVHAVVSDPPYEAHMHAAKRGVKVKGSTRRIRRDGHANPPPVDFASIDGIRDKAAEQAVRSCSGWVLIFCTPEGVAPWRGALEKAGAKYKRACVWVKPDSAPQFNGQGPAMGAEMFVAAWCGRGHSTWNGGGRRNVFTHPCQPPDRTGLHPTEKPVSLMSELVSLFTAPGQIVLDPFMGSGTTGVSCIRTGRRFIGIEKDETYFELACRRIRDASAQPDMFIGMGRPDRAKQLSLIGEDA
jgi:site-specific DNA-methyltransferase (adenine-specific)